MDSTSPGGAKNGVFMQWLKMPFSTNMDLFSWFLFLGFAIIAAYFWTRVLSHIVEAA